MPLGGIWIGLRCIEGKTVVLEVGGKEVLWTGHINSQQFGRLMHSNEFIYY